MLFILLASCAHVITKENREIAFKDFSFREILINTDNYINNVFILGGIIAKTTNTEKGTEIELVQSPIGRYGSIIDNDISEGRFLAKTSKHLDPLIYRNGREITIAGKLLGSKKKSLGDLEYNYPLFEVKEIYLWKEKRYYQSYSYDPFFFYPFYPYYYRYPYYRHDPFWQRPFIYRY
jgi:outer membrane lipoprotein